MSKAKGFSVIVGAFCVTMNKGVFKQVAIYERDSILFAAYGSGFIRMMHGGRTSHPSVRWSDLDGVTVSDNKKMDYVRAGNGTE